MRDEITAIFLAAFLAVSLPGLGSAADSVPAVAGKIDGSWHWRLPDTPNGLKAVQNWHATGSAPNGDIYVGGMDHVTNSALYRLKAGTNSFVYIGDAKSTSVAAGNWKPGETAEKFLTRPTWHNGKMHVATMDYSALDAGTCGSEAFTGTHTIRSPPASPIWAPRNPAASARHTSASSTSPPIRCAISSMERRCRPARSSATMSPISGRPCSAGRGNTIDPIPTPDGSCGLTAVAGSSSAPATPV